MKTVLYLFFISIATNTIGQTKSKSVQCNLTLGIGFPETLYGGVRINHKQWHFDASGGRTLGGLFTVNGNTAYHFGAKNSTESYNPKPWYTSLGASYIQRETSKIYSEDIYLNARIGRDFKMTYWFKLSLSAGLGLNLYHYKYDKDPDEWNFDIWLPVIPSGQFSFQFLIFDF